MSSSNVRFLRPAESETKTENKYIQTEPSDVQVSERSGMDVKRNKFLADDTRSRTSQSKGGFPLSDHVPMRQAMILVVATAAIGIAVGMLIPALSNSGNQPIVENEVTEQAQTSPLEQQAAIATDKTEQSNAAADTAVGQSSPSTAFTASERQPVPLDDVVTRTVPNDADAGGSLSVGSVRESVTGLAAPYDNDLREFSQSPLKTDLQVRIERTAPQPVIPLSEQSSAPEQETIASTQTEPQSAQINLNVESPTSPLDQKLQQDNIAAIPAQVEPVAEKEATATIKPLDEVELDRVLRLINRGDDHFDRGDILTARRFYELAARTNLPEAYDAIGRTYDPIILRTLPVLGLTGDSRKAREFYEMAQNLRDRIAAHREGQQ